MARNDLEKALKDDNFFTKIIIVIMVSTGLFEMLTVGSNALMRYIVKKDIRAVEEFITMVAFWMYFGGAIYAAKRREHISAEAISMFVKNPRVLYGIQMFKRVASLLICLIFAWWSLEFFWWGSNAAGKTNVYRIPLAVGYASVTMGFCGMLIYYVRDVIMLIRCKPSEYQPDLV